LRKRYSAGRTSLHSVSFRVEPGTSFAYLGGNGAGKSTKVGVRATPTLPTGGSARVKGLDLQTDAPRVRRRIGVTMQDAVPDDATGSQAQAWLPLRERAQRASDKYGAHCVSLLALKPVRASRHTSHPDLGGGADVAQAAREEGSTNIPTTEEVSK
jgi:ABC-type multidrug transport system ATPase subunit